MWCLIIKIHMTRGLPHWKYLNLISVTQGSYKSHHFLPSSCRWGYLDVWISSLGAHWNQLESWNHTDDWVKSVKKVYCKNRIPNFSFPCCGTFPMLWNFLISLGTNNVETNHFITSLGIFNASIYLMCLNLLHNSFICLCIL